jgi:hypothetical protein
MIRNCIVCGKEFETKRTRKTCDESCANDRKKQLHREAYSKTKTYHLKTCSVCGKEFETSLSFSNVCSKECSYQKYVSRHREMVTYDKVCCICETPFKTKNKNRVTCSRSCSYKHGKKLHSNSVNRNKKILYSQFNDTVTVDAKCPGCGIIHQKEVLSINVGGVMPRYYCNRYPACMNNFYDLNFDMSWQGNNGARI